MKKLLLLFTLAGLLFVSCNNDDDDAMTEDYQVNITIDQPTANAAITVNTPMDVKVSFSRGAEEVIHHVKVHVLDENGDMVEALLEDHAHTPGSYVFEKAAAFTPTVAGTYTLKAMSHDMMDNHTAPVEMIFTVSQ